MADFKDITKEIPNQIEVKKKSGGCGKYIFMALVLGLILSSHFLVEILLHI